jgi:hypothetical protein
MRRGAFQMYFLKSTSLAQWEFSTLEELQEFIEVACAQSGGFDWIESIVDDEGTEYGCSWTLEIQKID